MRPIRHAPLTSSPDASSCHPIDAVIADDRVPIGIPALFIADEASRDRSAEHILGGKRGLLAEYAGAEGYAFRWGQLIEIQLGRFVLWRVVPVTVWDRLSGRRAGPPLRIEEFLTLVQPGEGRACSISLSERLQIAKAMSVFLKSSPLKRSVSPVVLASA